MKKIGSVTMSLLVVLMVAPVFAGGVYLGQGSNPIAVTDTRPSTSMFVDPRAKGIGGADKLSGVYLGQGSNPIAVTDTRPSTSMFVDPRAKGIGGADKLSGVYLGQGSNPAAVTPTRINIFTGEPH